MLRTPPHILVTTPESLYLLLTAERSRERLRHVRTVIVDEIHAVIGTRRGAHLALSLERLAHVGGAAAAAHRPVGDAAAGRRGRALPGRTRARRRRRARRLRDRRRGASARDSISRSSCRGSPLEAVMSHEVWEEYYDRLAALIAQHRTTLVFVNTRKMAERVARHLTERLGEDAVAAHHGSLSKERRLDAEQRLKRGELKALVATASLELGIDIGHVDLVCQIGSPHRIATFLQRVGRAGHTIAGTPKGRLFPVSRDDLVECAALLARRAPAASSIGWSPTTRRSTCWRSRSWPRPRADEWREDELFALVRRAWPYRDLARADFDAVVAHAGRAASRRGAAGARALVHRDEVHGRLLRAPGGAADGASPRAARFPTSPTIACVLEPDELFVGTLNEDFAIESNAGDIFQLGNSSWRILQVGRGRRPRRRRARRAADDSVLAGRGAGAQRRAVDARSASCAREVGSSCSEPTTRRTPAPTARARPGWPTCSACRAVGGRADRRVPRRGAARPRRAADAARRSCSSGSSTSPAACSSCCTRRSAAASTAPGGWRCASASAGSSTSSCRRRPPKRACCCRSARSTRSRWPTCSATCIRRRVRDVLIQAFLDAPVFQTRWRWNATISLAVPRGRARPEGAGAAAADAGRRSAGGGVSRRRGVPREHSRRSPDSRSPAGRADGARLPRGGDGPRRA